MHYLKCNNCGHLNEVKTEYLTMCSHCGKKLDNCFSQWKSRNPEKTFDEYKQLICITEEEIVQEKTKTKTHKPKSLKYWIGFAITFAIFYAIGQFGGKAIVNYFKKPAFDKAMMEMASELNKTCPIMVDAETRFDNAVSLPGNIFQYNYTLVNMDKSSVDTISVKNYLEPIITNAVSTNPQMQFQRDHKTTINYYYKDKNGNYLFMISIPPEKYLKNS